MGTGQAPGRFALVHALPGDHGSGLWTVPADGTGAARRVMTSAVAPACPG
ncbi:hypothetical protein [Streptomyces sp. NPDC059970]